MRTWQQSVKTQLRGDLEQTDQQRSTKSKHGEFFKLQNFSLLQISSSKRKVSTMHNTEKGVLCLLHWK